MKNRQADIEREWRRIARRERLQTIYLPALGMLAAGSAVWALVQFTPYGKIIIAGITAVGLPLGMWMGRRK